MKQTYIKMMALAALPLCIGGALANNAVRGESNAERLVSMENAKGAHTPERVISIDGFLYEDFESAPDDETRLPEGWVTTSTPGNETDHWSAGTLGRGDTPLNGVSGYKYAFILGNQSAAHDSWMFSPAVTMTAGTEYTIEFFAMMPPVSGSDVMEKLEVFIGDAQNAESMTKQLEVIENDNDYWRYYGYTFVPETSGTYCMGFHSISPAGSNSTAIDDLKISSGDIAVFSGNSEVSLGSTDTRAGVLKGNYKFGNGGHAPLEVSLKECSPELTVEGLPVTLDEYQDGSFTITLTAAEAGDYSGYVKIATNDPTLPEVKIDVFATVKEARVSGYCLEDFEQGGPEGWDLCYGSGNVSANGGFESSRAWYCTTFYQTDERNEQLGGVGFTTHYVEMGADPKISFMYQLVNTDMMGSSVNGPTAADEVKVTALVTDDNGLTWTPVFTLEPGGEQELTPSADYQQAVIPVPGYAGKTCRFRLVFTQVKGSTMFNPIRTMVDNVSIGTSPAVDLRATALTGPATLEKGEQYSFFATIENCGNDPVAGYKVRLVNTADNSVIATADGAEIAAAGSESVPLAWTPDADGAFHLVAQVVSDDDTTPDNDISYPLHAIVLPEGNSVFEIGTEGERKAGMYYPVNYYAVDSESQSVYYANELGINSGVINSMVFRSSLESEFFSEPVSFYIGETDRADFGDERFVDADSFTKVFEGPLYMKEGMNDLVIPFDAPYEYKGGNIVIMGKKYGKEFIMGKYFMIRQTLDKETKRSINVSAFKSGALGEATPTTAAVYPEIRFNMVAAEAGSVSGKVADAEGAVEGALVKVAGTQLSAVTDATGSFTLPTVATGDVALEVSKHGYYSLTSDAKAVAKDANTEYDLTLVPLPRHTLAGAIVSKTTGEPIEGVKIVLKGYDDFETYSNDEGRYEIAGVCGDTGAGYSIRVSSDFFIAQTADLEVEADVEKNWELADKPLRVHNVGAVKIGDDVNVSWDSPMPEFSYDSGVPSDYIGWAHGQSNVIVASVFHNHARIKEISWYTTDQYGWHGNFNVFIFGLDAEGNPDVNNILYVARGVDFTDNAWSTHVLGNPVEADGFMIAVSCDGFLGIGITEPTEEYPFEEGQCFYAGDNYEWGIFPMSNFKRVHVMLRAYGENLGESTKAPAYASRQGIVRPAADYKVFRFADGADTADWSQIASTSENSYLDKTFSTLDEGKYRYAVVAAYADTEAPAIMSGTVSKENLGIDGVAADGLITLSPNPFTDVIYVNAPSLVREINIFSTSGTLCGSYRDFSDGIDTTGLGSGLYLVNVVLTDGKATTLRMIKN